MLQFWFFLAQNLPFRPECKVSLPSQAQLAGKPCTPMEKPKLDNNNIETFWRNESDRNKKAKLSDIRMLFLTLYLFSGKWYHSKVQGAGIPEVCGIEKNEKVYPIVQLSRKILGGRDLLKTRETRK